MDQKPELKVSVFSDYICPFCYVGHARLMRLRELYDLRVNWCFVEIHPGTPPEGLPVSALGYPQEQWRRMMAGLERLAAEEGLTLAERTFTTNSRKALLLAEAVKSLGADTFYALHGSIYEAYFRDGRNIGDPEVLRELAESCGVPAPLVTAAWEDPRYARNLEGYLGLAAQYEVRGVPTFRVGTRQFPGVVTLQILREAAMEAAS